MKEFQIPISGSLANQIAIWTAAGAALLVLVLHGRARGTASGRLLARAAVLAALTGALVWGGIIPYRIGGPSATRAEQIATVLFQIVWWASAAGALTAAVRTFLVVESRSHQGRLLQDLVVGAIYVGAVLCVSSYVFDAPVGTLIATSGVFAIIVGLALQSTLADLFSGIALNLSGPYRTGDWIVLKDAFEGKVIETNWRATHLLSGTQDLIVVPNSVLAKSRLTNMSGPERSHGVILKVRVRPTSSPAVTVDVMKSVLSSTDWIQSAPESGVTIVGLDAEAIEVELAFTVSDHRLAGLAKTEIYDLVYRHVLAAGLQLAAPVGSPVAASRAADDPRSTPQKLLDAVHLFSSLTPAEKATLAATMTRMTYRKGGVILGQGEISEALTVIRSGIAGLSRDLASGPADLGRLAPGDYVGEAGLLAGEGEPATVTALSSVVAYAITKEGLLPLMRERPSIAEELASLMAKRSAATDAKVKEGQHAGLHSVPGVAVRIREFFGL